MATAYSSWGLTKVNKHWFLSVPGQLGDSFAGKIKMQLLFL